MINFFTFTGPTGRTSDPRLWAITTKPGCSQVFFEGAILIDGFEIEKSQETFEKEENEKLQSVSCH